MDKYIKRILILGTIVMFLTGNGCMAASDTSKSNIGENSSRGTSESNIGENSASDTSERNISENSAEADSDDFISSVNDEKSKFGINGFLSDSQKYVDDDDFDISDIFTNALKGRFDNIKILKFCLNLFGQDFKKAITSIAGIVIVVVITAILKSISENLGNESTGKIAFFVEYILVVLILMKNFAEIVGKTRETIQNATVFSNSLIPLFTTLIIATGKINSAGVIEPILLLIVSFINNVISNLVIPLILASTALGIISKISDEVKVEKISKLIKKGSIWGISTALTLFITIASLEGGLTNNLDNFTKKAGKSVISVAVPVVGNILGSAIDTISRLHKFIKKRCWYNRNCSNCFNLCETDN